MDLDADGTKGPSGDRALADRSTWALWGRGRPCYARRMRRLLLPLLLLLPALPGPARAALYAAAGKADITPDLEKETVWLAGFGASGRRAKGVHDPLYVRALVVSDGKKTVALVGVDTLGLYREDVEDIRAELGWQGKDRYLFVSATHSHSTPDSLGLWGRFIGVSGVDKRYHARLKGAVAELVKELSGKLREAEMTAARSTPDPRSLCRDSRDPVVIDPELNALAFRTKKGESIGTLVRWSCHAEVMDSRNFQVTADFPGPMCSRIEEKTGGGCVFFPGAIGGLMTPDVDDSLTGEDRFKEMARVGHRVADEALGALKGETYRHRRAEVSFSTRVVSLPVENSRYLFFLPNLAFGHTPYAADGKAVGRLKTYWYSLRHLVSWPLPERLRPTVVSEVSLVEIGPVRILGIPGELFPELAIGGYDGGFRFDYPLVRPTNPNPPDLEKAPKGPYLRKKLKAKHGLIVGLANDMLGYFVPEYDFEVTPNRAMHPRPPGTHYEETNSLGRSATPLVLEAAEELLR